MKVLIIEDDSLWGARLQIAVERLGHEVIAVSNGLVDSKMYLEIQTPDLIIADIYLYDGKVFSLYKNKNLLAIPTIFVTGSNNENDYKQAKKLNQFVFLVKPFNPQTLNSTIELMVKKNSQHNETIVYKNIERNLKNKEMQKLYKIIGDDKIIDILNLDKREKLILKKYWQELKSALTIANELKLSSQRVQKIYNKIIEKIKTQLINNAARYKAYLEFSKRRKNILHLLENNVDVKKKASNQILEIDNKTKIDGSFGLSVKLINVLKNKNIITIEDLQQYTKKELLLFNKIGPFYITEIEKTLATYGLKLKS